jgi:branched-chain amino acid transport system permease protein
MPELPGHHSKYEKWRSDVVIARFIEMCIGAAVLGATYVLIGTGYNLAYSTVRVISFAQGQLAMVGSMVFATAWARGIPIPLALLIAVVVSGALSVLIERGVLTPILKSGQNYKIQQASLLATAAVGLVIDNLATVIWGTNLRATATLFGSQVVQLGSVVVSNEQLTVIGGSVVAMLLAWTLLQFTAVGLQIRAVAANSEAAVLQGVNVRVVVSLSFFVGGVLGGFAGILLAALSAADPSVGLNLSILGLIAALLGGLGNMRGLIPAAAVLGLLQSGLSTYVSTQYGDDMTLVVVLVYFLATGAARRWRPSKGRVITLHEQSVV